MSLGLARVEPAFYTNHELIHWDAAPHPWDPVPPKPAVIETAYKKDLVPNLAHYMLSIERLELSCQNVPLFNQLFRIYCTYTGATAWHNAPLNIFSIAQVLAWLNTVSLQHGVSSLKAYVNGDGFVIVDVHYATTANNEMVQLNDALARTLGLPNFLYPYTETQKQDHYYAWAAAQAGTAAAIIHTHYGTWTGAHGAVAVAARPAQFWTWIQQHHRADFDNHIQMFYDHECEQVNGWITFVGQSILEATGIQSLRIRTSLPVVAEVLEDGATGFILADFAMPGIAQTVQTYSDASNYTVGRTNTETLRFQNVCPQKLVYYAGLSRRWVDCTAAIPLRKIKLEAVVRYKDGETNVVSLPPAGLFRLKLAWYRKT